MILFILFYNLIHLTKYFFCYKDLHSIFKYKMSILNDKFNFSGSNIPMKKSSPKRSVLWRQYKTLITNVNDRTLRWPKVNASQLMSKIGILEEENKNNTDLINNYISSKNYNELLKMILIDSKQITKNIATNIFNHIQSDGPYIGKFINDYGDEQSIHINDITKKFFIMFLQNGGVFDTLNTFESDALTKINSWNILSVEVSLLDKPKQIKKNKDGKFFPYINTSKINLTDYQIFNQEQAYDKANIDKLEHCLIYTLLRGGVDISIVNEIKMSYIEGCNIRKADLKNISNIIKRDIILHYMCNTPGSTKIYKTHIKSNDKQHELINIGIYESHYFLQEITKYSKYCINNYEDIKNESHFESIVKKSGKYIKLSDKYKINSLLMIHKLFEKDYFKKLDLVKFAESNNHKDLKDHIYLNNIENEQRNFCDNISKKQVDKEQPLISYGDCESYVNGEYHKLQLMGVVLDDDDKVSILNVCDAMYNQSHSDKEQLLVYAFLNIITNNGNNDSLCYFHNLKYDYHLLEKFINITDKCEKDNQIYSVKIRFKGRVVEFRDSYKLLPFSLKKFQQEFDLPDEICKKEAISYSYYTEENNNKRINIMDYCNLLSNDEQLIFLKNIDNEPSYDKDNKTFNPMDYYKEYLRLDCLVLKKGMQKFAELIKEITENKMSIYDCLTISSLTDKYMIIEGAYDNVFSVKGNLRAYIAKAVYGGRVHVNPKYQKQIIKGKIADYDGVSLYPSAINRLCRESGLPIGKAKCLEKIQIVNWKKFDYSILTVKITKVNKIQQMPFIAHKSTDSIIYSNEPPENEIIIDSITLLDYIKFHDIEFKIIGGVYWNEGFNKKMGDVVKRLFDARLKYKKTNTSLANTIKLMLNSSYGKTIMKKTNSKIKILKANQNSIDPITKKWVKSENELFKSYIYNNFNTIKSHRKLNQNNYEVEKIHSDDSYNRGHIGCSILSMSKRIMNELFDVANDLDKPIYYTDTDSLHCNYEDIPAIETEYEKRYNKELTGKQLEQFHTDFNLEGACSEIYASKSIFLGKKSYIDALESKDINGKKIKGFHIRLKGITVEGLEHCAKQYSKKNEKPLYFSLYNELAHGVKKTFILNPYNKEEHKSKVLFEFKNGNVSTRKEFIRKVQF